MQPKRIAVADLSLEIGNSLDLFLCCASFESRSLSAGLSLNPAQVKFALVAKHVDYERYVVGNAHALLRHFSGASEVALLDTRSPIRSADAFAGCLRKVPAPCPERILVDVTTFTHETVIIVCELISRTFRGRDVQCVYTIAEEYDPEQDDQSKWLSKGIAEIRSVLGFPGAVLPGRGTHLILLHGFEEERSKSLIARYEPDLLSLGAPDTDSFTAPKHGARHHRVHEQVLRYARISVPEVVEFEFCADNHFGCRDVILKQAAIRPDLNIVAAPMNTKLSTLGVMLAARLNHAIQICYAQPNTYNVDNYSRPGDELYLFALE